MAENAVGVIRRNDDEPRKGEGRGRSTKVARNGSGRAGQGRVMSSNGFNFGFDGWKNKCVG